jgi:hypothetical protein
MTEITYRLSNGKKVTFEGRFGHTEWLYAGRFIMRHQPKLIDFKGVVKSATRIKLGEEDADIKGHSYTLIIERKGRAPLTASLVQHANQYNKPIIKKPASGLDLNLSEVIKRPSRPAVKGEAIKGGSVIKVKAGTAYHKKRYDRGMVCYDRYVTDQDLAVIITGEASEEASGRPIYQDGSVGDLFTYSSLLEGIISGYALARASNEFEVITLGGDMISHGIGMCL